jgi:hypothetical protein
LSKEKPSDGLFMVDCNVCHKLFAAENKLCECGSSKGELYLDIDKMLNRVYDLNASNKIDDSIDVVFDVFWQLHDKFETMNSILDKVDLSKIDSNLIVGFLVQTFKYIENISNHLPFCDRAEARLLELGFSEPAAKKLLLPYRDTGSFWINMEKYGAPEWLTGPKPNTKD